MTPTEPSTNGADVARADNVIEALRRVITELPAIGKDLNATAAQGGYAYRGIEQITREVQPLFAKHGVVFVPRVLSAEVVDILVGGKPWTDTRLMVEYTVFGPGGRDDHITVGPIFAIGRDNSDKGANKCMTQAFKYGLLQTFMIADAKDDADGSTHEAETPPPPAVEERKLANGRLVARLNDTRQEVRNAYLPWRDQELKAKRLMYETGIGYTVESVTAIMAKLDELDMEVADPTIDPEPVDRLVGDVACDLCGAQPGTEHDPDCPTFGAGTPPPGTAPESPQEPSGAPDASGEPDPAEAPFTAEQNGAGEAPTSAPDTVSAERQGKVRARVKRYTLAEVRNQLAAVEKPTNGKPDEIRERLALHLIGLLPPDQPTMDRESFDSAALEQS